MTMQVPFTVYMGRDPSDGPLWGDYDRIVMEAWITYQSELCGTCGVHAYDGQGDENAERWEEGYTECHSCKAIDRGRKFFSSKDPRGNERDASGISIYAQDLGAGHQHEQGDSRP